MRAAAVAWLRSLGILPAMQFVRRMAHGSPALAAGEHTDAMRATVSGWYKQPSA